MKQIQPIQIWVNGQQQTGSWILSYITNDNLNNSATFYWAIYTAETGGIAISTGQVTMEEPDYTNWDNSDNINLAAYQWVCDQLGLTLI